MAAKGPILITGFNGYLAAQTALLVLKAGYPVRGTVRNVEAGEKTKAALIEYGYDANLVEVVTVPEISTKDAFDQAVVGCSAILHLASPIADIFILSPQETVRVAVDATTNIIDSATKYAGSQLKSIVLMSSSGAMIEYPTVPAVLTEEDWAINPTRLVMKDTEELAKLEPPFLQKMLAYTASKACGEKAFWAKRDELIKAAGGDKSKIPSMTAVQGSWFFGPPLVPWTKVEGMPYSGSFLTRILAGEEPSAARMSNGTVPSECSIDVRDVGRVLLWSALNPSKADGERLLASSAAGGAQAVADILDRKLQNGTDEEKEMLKGLKIQNKGNPGQGYNADYSLLRNGTSLELDGDKVSRVTGEEYIPFEQSVMDMVRFAWPLVRKAGEEKAAADAAAVKA